MYQNIALNAISQDIKTSPWGSVSVYSESNKELQKVLNTEFYPEFLFRIGCYCFLRCVESDHADLRLARHVYTNGMILRSPEVLAV